MSPKLRNLLFTLTLLFASLGSIAQGKPDAPPPPDSRTPPPPVGLEVPIDENLMILFIVGIGAGIYYSTSRKNTKAV